MTYGTSSGIWGGQRYNTIVCEGRVEQVKEMSTLEKTPD